MDPARSDGAERLVFDALPQLDAVPRRGLALALSGVPRAGIASQLGLAGEELSGALAAGRKALRRTRTELPSGGRCERAERALSDQLDGVLGPLDQRFLESHLARCTRCRTHATELDAALEALHAELAAPPQAVALAAPKPARARLRVVPAPALLPPAPEPPVLEPAPAAPEPPVLEPAPAAPEPRVLEPAPAVPEPRVLEPAPAAPEPPTLVPEPVVAQRPAPTPAHVAVRRNRSNSVLPVAVAALVAVGLIAAAIALLMHFNNGNSHARAPWDQPHAPIVHPVPLKDQ